MFRTMERADSELEFKDWKKKGRRVEEERNCEHMDSRGGAREGLEKLRKKFTIKRKFVMRKKEEPH